MALSKPTRDLPCEAASPPARVSHHKREAVSPTSHTARDLPGKRSRKSKPVASPKVLRVGSICTGMGTCFRSLDVIEAWNEDTVKFDHRWACEISSACQAVLQASYPNLVIFKDATKCLEDAIGVDVLLAGPPCQQFSYANRKRKNLADSRPIVYEAIVDYIVARKPRVFLIENVLGLLSNGAPVVEAALSRFQEAGYRLAARKLDSHKVGHVPQRRWRVYFVGVLAESTTEDWAASLWPHPLPIAPLSSILDYLPQQAGALPTAPRAQAKVLRLTAALEEESVPQEAQQEMVVNCNSIHGRANCGYTPCLTASRGASGGFWLTAQHRMMTLDEMMRLQGMEPSSTDTSMVSKCKAGHMIGNAFTQSVITRIMARAIPAASLTPALVDPYDQLGRAQA